MREPVFALDIGTRTVVGILAVPTESGRIAVVDAEAIEHGDRAMRDGQVHDIPEVGRRIRMVAEQLAARSGLRLERAYVAAAGRALKTVEVDVALPVPRPGEVSERLIRELATAGVAEAVGRLAAPGGRASESFHCVGFSVVRHRLDGDEIANPLGQRGDRLEATLIATFLPRVVTDGLVFSLQRAGLDIAGLTLEPIAAVNVAIAPTMRQLNLALVDIGAGTSDIALTRDGAVTGYAMVPQAGDAMTEALAQDHLLDFPEAERLKKAYGSAAARLFGGERLSSEFRFEASDVLGMPLHLVPAQLDGPLQGPVAELSGRISREILQLNGRAPAAVVCIGGGSLTPGLAAAIAQRLGLPASRVGVRGAEMVKTVDLAALGERPEILDLLAGPSGVTPLGIAWGALHSPGFGFVEAWVRPWDAAATEESKRVQILDLGRATVLDALVAAGVPPAQLAGRPGLGLALRVDGRIRLVAGTRSEPALVEIDGVRASLDALLVAGARLTYRPARDGADAAIQLGDLEEARSLELVLDGRVVSVPPALTVDGEPAPVDRILRDGAEIHCDRSLGRILEQAGRRLERQVLRYRLDGIWQELPRRTYVVRVDGVERPLEAPLLGGERIEVDVVDHGVPRVADVVPGGAERVVALYLNGERIEVPIRGFTVLRRNSEIPLDTPISDGDDLAVEPSGQPIVADLLALIQSELVSASGPLKSLELRVDGAPAQFTTPLREGSRIEARWVEIPV